MKNSLTKQSIYMLAALASTSVLGLVFWKTITQGYDTSQVGQLSSILSFGMLVATFVTSGTISELFADSYSNQHEHKKIIAAKSLSAGILTIIITLTSGLILASLNNFEFLKTPANLAGVVLFAGLTSYSLVLDAGLTANISAGVTLVRHIAQSVTKIIAALIIMILITELSGVTNGIVASVISLIISVGYILWRYFKKETFVKPDFKISNWSKHQVLSSGFIILPLSLPLIINIVGTSDDAAIFYISWLFGSIAYLIAPTIANAMLSKVDDTDNESFKNNIKKLKQTLAFSTAITVVSLLGFIIIGKPLLSLFGRNYESAYVTLCVIGVISIFNGVTQTMIGYLKTTGYIYKVYWMPWIPFVVVTIYVFIASILGNLPLENIALSWLYIEVILSLTVSTILMQKVVKIFK